METTTDTDTQTTAEDLAQALRGAVAEGLADALSEVQGTDDPPYVESVCTFEDSGLLTREAGLVVRLSDGTEFQLTVVDSTSRRW